ncbi:AlpA family transcriptional regulator [Pseudomonas sp. GD03721]|nr:MULTISPECIES: AlpA family phage regulatory protein [unclassified Pseudomonas]MDH1440354.1 AlpA family transcriptional regulator [Pseudomonas sp. GD03722]WGG03556.1 AlpA family transcriptional regulator [Pseudomonas sp. GD03721]WGG07724.1 AlpA family transcriptional regulator [Pseudomonas sp. GD03919]
MQAQTAPIPATAPQAVERHIMRRDEVERLTGFKRAHIYSLMRQGKFPQAKRIGLRAVGWDSLEIEQWIAERLTRQD